MVSAVGHAGVPLQTHTLVVTRTHPYFTITLPSNPTTGYSWVVVVRDPLIQEVKNSYQPNRNKQFIGAPGVAVWQFKVMSTAFHQQQHPLILELRYLRPWDHADVASTYKVKVLLLP